VHLGAGNYLQRYKTYVTHAQQWRQQFDKLEFVDLRYDGPDIVNPIYGMARQPALTPTAAKAAMPRGENRGARELRELSRIRWRRSRRGKTRSPPQRPRPKLQCIMLP